MNKEFCERIEKLFRRPLTDEQATHVFTYLVFRIAKRSSTTGEIFLKKASEAFREGASKDSPAVLASSQVDGPVASKQSR